jgi:hypothetical protein
MTSSAPRQSHIVNITAGSNTIRTKITLAYDEVGALFVGKDYKRLSARFNNDITINKYLSSSIDFYVKRSIYENPSTDPMERMRIAAPVYAAVWSNGLVAEGKSGDNVYASLNYGGFSKNWYNQVGGKASLDFTPLSGLKLSAVISPEFNYNKTKTLVKKIGYTNYNDPTLVVGYISPTTSLNESRADSYRVTSQLIANYTKSFGSHNLNGMVGFESFHAFNEGLGSSSTNLLLNSYSYLDLGNKNFLSSYGNANENAYQSYFGRILYNYNNKYYLQGNVRYWKKRSKNTVIGGAN